MFKEIPFIAGYEVSTEGSIRIMQNLYLKSIRTDLMGYSVVTIRQRPYHVHVLVMRTFVGEYPAGCTIDHIDGKRTNNTLSNLRYATAKEQRKNTKRPSNYKSQRGIVASDNSGQLVIYDTARSAANHLSKSDECVLTNLRKIYTALKDGTQFKNMHWRHQESDLEWFDIPEEIVGMNGYKVSKCGLVKLHKGRETAGCLKNGYMVVNIQKKMFRVHVLIAETFLKRPDYKCVVNHKNGVKTDNRLENLEFCTYQENSLHAYKIGLIPENKGRHVQQWSTDGVLILTHISICKAAQHVSGNTSNIIACCKGRSKSAYGFLWKYE